MLNSATHSGIWELLLTALSLSLNQPVLNLFNGAFLELRRINSIRNFLTTEIVKTIVCSLFLSRIDDCDSLLTDLPQCLVKKIQYVKNVTAKMIVYAPKADQFSSSFKGFTGYPLPAEQSKKCLYCVTALYLELGHNTCQT